MEQLSVLQLQLLSQSWIRFSGGKQLIKYVVISFSWGGAYDSTLLEQIIDDTAASNGTIVVEVNRNQFTETRRVVITESFRITESL